MREGRGRRKEVVSEKKRKRVRETKRRRGNFVSVWRHVFLLQTCV